jgi:polyhydroxybutyrate depolymerase
MRMPTCVMVVASLLGCLLLSASAVACGPTSDCVIGERHYRIRMPDGHDGNSKIGAIVIVHGYRGHAAQAMQHRDLTERASRLGVALIAVKAAGNDWAIPGAPSVGAVKGVDELAYFDRVLADAAARFPIDRARLMVSGFSAGAMMVWNLACYRSGSFAGFMPVAGTFWRPQPETCPGPVASIIHVHGDADPIVPLEGRTVQDAQQGVVADALAMYANVGNFGPPGRKIFGELSCEDRIGRHNSLMRFCLFAGGHNFRAAHVETAWHMFVEANKLH